MGVGVTEVYARNIGVSWRGWEGVPVGGRQLLRETWLRGLPRWEMRLHAGSTPRCFKSSNYMLVDPK